MSHEAVAEIVDTKTGEVLPSAVALVPAIKPDAITSLIKEADRPIFNAMEGMATLDWKDLKPNQMAVLLMSRPMAVSGGGVLYLNFRQALYFAVRAYELGVSPFSSAVWFDPQKFTVNLTLEGKREVARNRGIDLGPPSFEETTREWKDIPRMTETAEAAKKAGFTKDVGVKCIMRVGDPKNNEHGTYTAYLSEWFQPKSPLWINKPMHMLTTRATEKTISLALGTGASSLPSEGEIEG